MATKGINVRPSGSKAKDIFSRDLPNIDANYGPWDSEEAYMSWLSDTMKVEGEPLEGTQIAVKDSETGKISVKIFSDGEFVDIGSGKVDYEETDAGVDYASLNVVSYDPQLGKSPEEKFQARHNIGALGQGDLDGKQDKLTSGTPLFKYNNKTVGYGNELPEGFFGGGGGSSTVANAVLVSGNQSIDGEKTFNGTTHLTAANISGQLKYTKKNSGENAIGAGVLMRDGQGNVSSKAVSALGVSWNNLTDKPIIPSAPVKSNWTEQTTSSLAYIENKPDISTNELTNTTTVSGHFVVGGNTTLGDSATDTVTLSGSLTLGTLTANSILKLDNNKKVVSDTGYYMKFGGELDSYDDLPDSSVEVGDTRYIRDKDEFVVASSVTNDNNLYIRVPGVNLITLNVAGTNPTHPIVSYSDLKSNLAYVHTTYSNYPLIDYYYHSLPAGGDGRLRVIPVNGGDYGTIVVLASTQKIFVVTTQDDGGPVNSWYCTGLDNTGEVEDITSSLPENDITIRTFTVFGGGVVWTGTKDYTEDNTIKFAPQTLTEAQKARARLNIGALGADNINSIFNATYYAAGFNSPEKTELDDNLAFEKIGSLLSAGIVPTLCVLEDGISCYYTYWKYIPTGSALDEWGIAGTEKDYHAFSTWKYEDGSLKFKVQLCESGSLNLTTKYIPDATQS